MQHHRCLASALALVSLTTAACEVSIGTKSGVDERKVHDLIRGLQVKSGVVATDIGCPDHMQAGHSYTCTVRTSIGDELVDLTVGRDYTGEAEWHRPLLGGAALAAMVPTFDGGRRPSIDCTGQVIVTNDPASIAICPEIGRAVAHVAVSGSSEPGKVTYAYFDEVNASLEQAVGGAIERIDCPAAEVIRGLRPFTCTVWRDRRLLEVTVTRQPEGWHFATVDRGPAPAP